MKASEILATVLDRGRSLRAALAAVPGLKLTEGHRGVYEHGGVKVYALVEGAELRFADELGSEASRSVNFRASLTDLFHHQLPRFPRELETARERGERLILVAPAEHHDRLADLLEGRELPVGPGGVELVAGELERGFRLPDASVVLFGEAQLFPRRTSEPARRRAFFSGLRDLRVGDYVVHEDHGIGQFVATRLLAGGGQDGDGTPPALQGLGAESPKSGGLEHSP